MNHHERIFEDFITSVKSANMEELLRMRTEMYASPGQRQVIDRLRDWYELVKRLEPDCSVSRLHHFLNGSSVPVGVCRIDDLPGDFSAEKFLRSSSENRKQMAERLRELEDGNLQMAA